MGRPFSRGHNLRSAKCARGLLEKLGLCVKFNLIEDEDLGGDKPDCETNHKRAERERPARRHRHSRVTQRIASCWYATAHHAIHLHSSSSAPRRTGRSELQKLHTLDARRESFDFMLTLSCARQNTTITPLRDFPLPLGRLSVIPLL